MKSERYFLAVSLPEAQKERLVRLQDLGKGFSFPRKENLHLTLRFIGALDDQKIKGLLKILGEIKVTRFILPLEGVGVFPRRGKAKVVWAGVGNAHPRLYQLRQLFDDALLHLGLDVDLRVFQPHVTIARIREEGKKGTIEEWLKRWRNFEGPPFRVESVGLYRSVPGPEGRVYEMEGDFRLK